MKLWDKGYGIDREILRFTVGDDYLLDQKLLKWDAIASIAHAKTLRKAKLLSDAELNDLVKGLKEIILLSDEGKFTISPEEEDCHTAIENYLTKKIGEAGKKIHTGRSRNDQVLAALKLYMKHELLITEELCISLAKQLIAFGEKNSMKMPGYTHMQKAMPSSVPLWAGAFAESMLGNLRLLYSAYDCIDSSPLGSAAGYGTSFDMDRKYTSDLLGFSRVQNNVLYVQNSRGKNEAVVLSSLMNVMLDLNKMATDLILFSLPEFGYFELPKEFCTGSSIMPQKKNPDVLELVRAKSKVVESYYVQVLGIVQNLPSGYNRDFQLTKKPLIEGIETVQSSLIIMASVIENLKVNEAACQNAMTKELYAADYANELVKKGMPFRDAYRKAASEIEMVNPEGMPQKVLQGSPDNAGLGPLKENISNAEKLINGRRKTLNSL